MARSKMGGEFLGADAIDSSLVHHHAGTKQVVPQVDPDERAAERKRLLDELAELRQDAAEELSELQVELDKAVAEHEAQLEVACRRQLLGSNFTSRRDHWKELEGRLIREIQSATPQFILDALERIKKFGIAGDDARRQRCDVATAKLERLVMVTDVSKEDAKAILAELFAGEVEAL